MDVCSKIFSIILNNRLYTLLGKHGTKCQFGATPNKGCRDGSFTLKTLLTQRKEHDQESFVLFVDLVKAYDTVNHELLIEILEQYGAPPKIRSAIKRMYTDLTVRITLDGVSAEIPQTVGVRQGDNLSPVLFLFFMSAFAESLETEWEHQGLSKAEFMRTPVEEVGNDFGQLTSHPLIDSNCPTPYGGGSIFEILQLLYIDDGAFVFNNRANLERGAEVINEHFKKFGMEMHVGRDEKKAKTEFMFVPTQEFFKVLKPRSPYGVRSDWGRNDARSFSVRLRDDRPRSMSTVD